MRSFRVTLPDARALVQHLRLTSLCMRIDTITFLYTHASVSRMSARSLGAHCLAMRVCAVLCFGVLNQHCSHLHSHHERKHASTSATAHTQKQQQSSGYLNVRCDAFHIETVPHLVAAQTSSIAIRTALPRHGVCLGESSQRASRAHASYHSRKMRSV